MMMNLRKEERRREKVKEESRKGREREGSDDSEKLEREIELACIKEQYLGSKNPKKRMPKPSEKFRFSFDWEITDDTPRDTNSLHQNPHEARPLFGRDTERARAVELAYIKEQYLGSKNPKKRMPKPNDKFRPSFDWEITDDTSGDTNWLRPLFCPLFCRVFIGQKRMRADRHWSEKKLEEMTERDWRIFKEDFNISYKGNVGIWPMRSWGESKLDKKLLRAVERAGYKTPSPIQMAAIPLGLQQRDVIGIAHTGSGKTAAFVLPMLNYIITLNPPLNNNDGPYAVPTRERAHQIEKETIRFAHYLGIKVVSIVGGQSIQEQGFTISQGCDVVIATPGRLLECLERRYVLLNNCNYVVLDEADRMIDIGFEPQVVAVLDAMPSSNMKPENQDVQDLDHKRIYRTTYMFSATMPPAIERLARNYLRSAVVINVGTEGKPFHLIKQHIVMTNQYDKMVRLKTLVDQLGDRTAIVFVNSKRAADVVAKELDREAYSVTTLQGGKSQEQRHISLEAFRTKRCNLLVATDVACCGIDIPDVAHVINYDMPSNIETYTHRIGRTGRAGKTGVATTFLTLADTDVFFDLHQMLIQTESHVPPELARHEASKFKCGSVPDRPSRRNCTH